jgi:hypothetical protein
LERKRKKRREMIMGSDGEEKKIKDDKEKK